MATFVFTNAKVTVNGVDLSNHVAKVTIKASGAEVDNTAMGATYHSRLGGLLDWTCDIEFNQDFAAASVDATLFPLLGATTTVTVNPTNAANSSTNPQYSGTALLKDYDPMDGKVGELAKAVAAFVGAGTLSRLTV